MSRLYALPFPFFLFLLPGRLSEIEKPKGKFHGRVYGGFYASLDDAKYLFCLVKTDPQNMETSWRRVGGRFRFPRRFRKPPPPPPTALPTSENATGEVTVSCRGK